MIPAPSLVKVNGRKILIKYVSPDAMPGASGLFRSQRSLIEISTDQEPQELKDTVIHELLHAILHTQGREYGGEAEEVYVRALATGLLGLLTDNPKLHPWLTQRN